MAPPPRHARAGDLGGIEGALTEAPWSSATPAVRARGGDGPSTGVDLEEPAPKGSATVRVPYHHHGGDVGDIKAEELEGGGDPVESDHDDDPDTEAALAQAGLAGLFEAGAGGDHNDDPGAELQFDLANLFEAGQDGGHDGDDPGADLANLFEAGQDGGHDGDDPGADLANLFEAGQDGGHVGDDPGDEAVQLGLGDQFEAEQGAEPGAVLFQAAEGGAAAETAYDLDAADVSDEEDPAQVSYDDVGIDNGRHLAAAVGFAIAFGLGAVLVYRGARPRFVNRVEHSLQPDSFIDNQSAVHEGTDGFHTLCDGNACHPWGATSTAIPLPHRPQLFESLPRYEESETSSWAEVTSSDWADLRQRGTATANPAQADDATRYSANMIRGFFAFFFITVGVVYWLTAVLAGVFESD